MNSSNQYLVFKGLDTYADVYLNDSLILKADNMFREWSVDVKGILKKGDNKLRVYFHSPIKIDPEMTSLKTEACWTEKSVSLPVRQAIITVGTGGRDWLLLVYGDLFILKHGMM